MCKDSDPTAGKGTATDISALVAHAYANLSEENKINARLAACLLNIADNPATTFSFRRSRY